MKKNVIHQLKTLFYSGEGMGFVFEADDGSLLVYDGGMDYDGEMVLDYLKEITGSDKPVVDAWFVSHAHDDHAFAAKGIALRHKDEITVKKFIYNFPPKEYFMTQEPGCCRVLDLFDQTIEIFGAEKVIVHRGDSFTFGTMKIDVIFTWEDLLPISEEPTQNCNDTSTVFKMTANGQTAIFLGDAEYPQSRSMLEKIPEDLKSDICQASHHGSYGASPELYAAIDPEIVYWPSVDKGRHLIHMANVPASYALAAKLNVKDIYVAEFGHTPCEMPIKPRSTPYLPDTSKIPEYKDKIAFECRKAEIIPNINDPYDKAWDQAEERSLDDGWVRAGLERVGGAYKMLWSENKFYLNVRLDKKFVSNPDRRDSNNSDVLNVYITEEPVRDRFILWKNKDKLPKRITSCKIYPEYKNVGGEKILTNKPEVCRSAPTVEDERFFLCAEFSFEDEKKVGDVIAATFEFTGVTEPEGKRTHNINLINDYENYWSAYWHKPSSLAFIKLI